MTRTTIPGDPPPLNRDDQIIQALKSLLNEIRSLKEDLASMRKEMITKEDLASMITKEDLASMRKEMITKEDLASMRKEMITKEDLASMRKEMITKEDLASMGKEMEDRLKKTENALKLNMFETKIVIQDALDDYADDFQSQFEKTNQNIQYLSNAVTFNRFARHTSWPPPYESLPVPDDESPIGYRYSNNPYYPGLP